MPPLTPQMGEVHSEKYQFTGKDPDAGKDWGHEEKGMTEHETIEWHH